MLKTGLVIALSATATAAVAYDAKDARYVRPQGTAQELAYVVCLEGRMRGVTDLQAGLARAAKACKAKAPNSAADIRAGVLECGFKKGDGSPDMGCAQ